MNELPQEDELDPCLKEQALQRLIATALSLFDSNTFNDHRGNTAEGLPREYGRYQLLEVIGHGGMGHVYRATHTDSGREVALKILERGMLSGLSDLDRENAIRRFEVESRVTTNLDHDNIITVYDVGEHDGDIYYAMELIDGQFLDRLAGSRPLKNGRAALIAASVANGIEQAHQAGVIHRDLKPANIMIDAQDRPHVTDFGLANFRRGDSVQQTCSGTFPGTVAYMAPEQFLDAASVAPAADVYGIGAVFYYLLTGVPPFDSKSELQTLKLLLEGDPVDPKLRNPAVTWDLSTICLKCLNKEPDRRYRSAAEVAADLRRYLDARPIHGRRATLIDRFVKWFKRNS